MTSGLPGVLTSGVTWVGNENRCFSGYGWRGTEYRGCQAPANDGMARWKMGSLKFFFVGAYRCRCFFVSRFFCLKIYSIPTCLDFGCCFFYPILVFLWIVKHFTMMINVYNYIYTSTYIYISCMIRIYVSNAPGTSPLANRRNQSSKSAKRSCVEHFPTGRLHDSEYRTGLFFV